jgi:transcriptional regulator with XRE-family HTH domain
VAAWIRQTGTSRPQNSTAVFAVLAHSGSLRQPRRDAPGMAWQGTAFASWWSEVSGISARTYDETPEKRSPVWGARAKRFRPAAPARHRLDLTSMMLDDSSSMEEEVHGSLNDRIGQHVRALRGARGLSLEAMASRCDVSRSMISLIERGESSPTAVVLEKIAMGLNVPLTSLFEAVPADDAPIARRGEQPLWRDPQSGCVRRNVSPGGTASPISIVEVSFPPRAHVAYETGAREPRIHQQVWVLEGAIVVTMGDETHRLEEGDCLAMVLDRPVSFRNDTRRDARYAVVIVAEPWS